MVKNRHFIKIKQEIYFLFLLKADKIFFLSKFNHKVVFFAKFEQKCDFLFYFPI